MENDGNNITEEIIDAAGIALGSAAKEEMTAVCAHILKQVKSFEVINEIDTEGTQPMFGVADGESFRAERIR